MSLESTFASHGFELSKEEVSLFEQFLSLFMAYNAHTNLSAIRDDEGIIEKHFIDSLYGTEAINSFLPTDKESIRLLDIGSGWGFPGIPLKIVMPELDITLLDSVGKKVKAMNHFITELWLHNIEAIQERAEILAKNPKYNGWFDFVVSRATAFITDILTWATPFLTRDGKIILYKMPSEDEIKERDKVMKKLWLKLVWEYEYELAGKVRVISIFEKR